MKSGIYLQIGGIITIPSVPSDAAFSCNIILVVDAHPEGRILDWLPAKD
jgi:hypothetical protein